MDAKIDNVPLSDKSPYVRHVLGADDYLARSFALSERLQSAAVLVLGAVGLTPEERVKAAAALVATGRMESITTK